MGIKILQTKLSEKKKKWKHQKAKLSIGQLTQFLQQREKNKSRAGRGLECSL